MRLLLIEDEVRFGRSLQQVLASEGYAVDWAQTGDSGWKKATMEEYDLLIVDIGLPDISGLEVVSRLREQENHVPVLFLTALGQTKDKVRGLDKGGDDYLVKPVDTEELLARIRSLTRRPQASEPIIYQYDTLTLDPARRSVSRSHKEIKLSLKEYSLLEYLFRNQGNVLSRQDLLDHVWDGSVDPFTNTIDVYIGYLRKKLERPFPKEKKLIQTVNGIGYKLEALK